MKMSREYDSDYPNIYCSNCGLKTVISDFGLWKNNHLQCPKCGSVLVISVTRNTSDEDWKNDWVCHNKNCYKNGNGYCWQWWGSQWKPQHCESLVSEFRQEDEEK